MFHVVIRGSLLPMQCNHVSFEIGSDSQMTKSAAFFARLVVISEVDFSEHASDRRNNKDSPMLVQPSMRLHGLRRQDQVMRNHANDSSVWAVNIGYKEERNRCNYRQDQKREHTCTPLTIPE